MTNASATSHVLRTRLPHATSVELLGEPYDWLTPHPLGDGGDGAFERMLTLPSGAYSYKLKVDGEWQLDPDNPRTRARDGRRDSLLVIGGASEPVLFAPGLPFVHEARRGGVVITAGLRRGAAGELEVVWADGTDEELTLRAPMQVVIEEDEHVMFRARVPMSAARARYAIALDGRIVAGPYEWTRTPATEQLPAWWRDAIVYAIFVDRFRAATDDDAWGEDPGGDVAAGGHLDGIVRSLDELADLGVSALYLTPVHVAASCHRYDVVDPWRVDPALGGDAALDRLIRAAHARRMRIVLDFSLSHVGRGFAPLEDVIAHGRASRFAGWFQWTAEGKLRSYGARDDAPLLDLDGQEVRTMACDLAEHWARRGVDGFRLDAAAEVPMDLARAIRARLRAVRPDAIVLGEVVPAHAWRWRAEEAVDAATDFGFHALATSFIARRTSRAEDAARQLMAIDLARGGDASAALRFVSTHDHARFSTIARVEGGATRTPLGLALLLTSPGVPALLYGEEVGLSASEANLEPEAAWRDRAPMAWNDARRDLALRAIVKRLLAVRAASPALRYGDIEVLHAEGDILVYRRSADGEVIDVVLHVGDGPVEIDVDDDVSPGIEPLATIGTCSVRGSTLSMGPSSAIVVRRLRTGAATQSRRLRQLDACAVRDEDFVTSALAPRVGPTRIDFAITELCNLRCRHCITHAPTKTRAGSARTLSPWLVDRLRDHLAYADYFGFVHGGESLVSPVLFEVLRAIRSARGGFPYVAHLLTNGVLLGERTAARLVEQGVTSLSVSLDGATARTNDAVRDGGRFDDVVANLRAAVRTRRTLGADLRLGISFVVLESNIDELDAFVDLAADIGVDWIKLEEAVGVNDFARRSLLRMERSPYRDRVARAAERGRTHGLVVVDHTAPPRVWRCRIADDDAMRAFLAADEFANRSDIHPCRAAWETACIEPNGDVRIGDFFGAALGNVAFDSLDELWTGAVARSERTRAQTTRLCGAGPVTCITPRG